MGLSANVVLQWILEVAYFCPGVPMLLVGCKQDLRCSPRVIEQLKRTNQKPVTPEEVRCDSTRAGRRFWLTHAQGLAVSQVIGAECYFECSARTGEGVQEVFNYAARVALLRPGKINKTKKCLVL